MSHLYICKKINPFAPDSVKNNKEFCASQLKQEAVSDLADLKCR